jgi:hypothetical protein
MKELWVLDPLSRYLPIRSSETFRTEIATLRMLGAMPEDIAISEPEILAPRG